MYVIACKESLGTRLSTGGESTLMDHCEFKVHVYTCYSLASYMGLYIDPLCWPLREPGLRFFVFFYLRFPKRRLLSGRRGFSWLD